MTRSTVLPLIPNLQPTSQFVNKDGNLLPMWSGFLSQIITTLQTHLSQEGLKVPTQTQDVIDQLNDPIKTHGNFLVNDTTGQLQFNLNGVWKTVTLT